MTTKTVRYFVRSEAQPEVFKIYDTVEHRDLGVSHSKEDAEALVQALNSQSELQDLRAIVQALREFDLSSNSSVKDLYAWLVSTTPFVKYELLDPETFSPEKAKVAEVLNSLDVVDSSFGGEPYILVEDNEENRSKLRAVGVTDEQISAAGDDGTFCLFALAFWSKEPLVNGFVGGKFV